MNSFKEMFTEADISVEDKRAALVDMLNTKSSSLKTNAKEIQAEIKDAMQPDFIKAADFKNRDAKFSLFQDLAKKGKAFIAAMSDEEVELMYKNRRKIKIPAAEFSFTHRGNGQSGTISLNFDVPEFGYSATGVWYNRSRS